jgi:hypothetical protein
MTSLRPYLPDVLVMNHTAGKYGAPIVSRRDTFRQQFMDTPESDIGITAYGPGDFVIRPRHVCSNKDTPLRTIPHQAKQLNPYTSGFESTAAQVCVTAPVSRVKGHVRELLGHSYPNNVSTAARAHSLAAPYNSEPLNLATLKSLARMNLSRLSSRALASSLEW